MALDKASDIILLIFVSISIPIYIIFIATVLRNRSKEPFRSAFFTLAISLGVSDIFMLFHEYFFVKTAAWGWFKEFWLTYGSRGSFLAFYSIAMAFAFTAAQFLGVLLLSINRFTAIVFYSKHTHIWSSRNIRIAITLQWIIPVIFVIPMSFTQFEYNFFIRDGIKDNDSLCTTFVDNTFMTAYYIVSPLLQSLVLFTTCCLYVAVFIKALKHAKWISRNSIAPSAIQSTSRPSTRPVSVKSQFGKMITYEVVHPAFTNQPEVSMYNIELRLAFSGLLLFLVMFAYFLHLVFLLITGDEVFDGGLFYNIVCDVFCCMNPYFLLIMSKPTRFAFLKTMRCG